MRAHQRGREEAGKKGRRGRPWAGGYEEGAKLSCQGPCGIHVVSGDTLTVKAVCGRSPPLLSALGRRQLTGYKFLCRLGYTTGAAGPTRRFVHARPAAPNSCLYPDCRPVPIEGTLVRHTPRLAACMSGRERPQGGPGSRTTPGVWPAVCGTCVRLSTPTGRAGIWLVVWCKSTQRPADPASGPATPPPVTGRQGLHPAPQMPTPP